jgi:hypothetical protein
MEDREREEREELPLDQEIVAYMYSKSMADM